MKYRILILSLLSSVTIPSAAQQSTQMPTFTMSVDVVVDQETGKHYRPMIGDGDWSKVSDPFWMYTDPAEKKQARQVALLERLASDEKANREFNSHSPSSCEGMYYGLFTDGVHSKDVFQFEGDNLADDFSFTDQTYKQLKAVTGVWSIPPKERMALEKDFNELKQNFLSSFANEPSILQNPMLASEIDHRAKSAELFLDPKEKAGFIDPMTDCRDKNFTCYKTINLGTTSGGKTIYNMPIGSKVTVGLGVRKLLKVRSSAARIWSLGHELSHSSDIASPEVVACLTHNLDLHRTLKTDIDKMFGNYGVGTPSSKRSGEDSFSGGGTEYTQALRAKLLLEKQLRACKKNPKSCTKDDVEFMRSDLAEAKNTIARSSYPLLLALSSMSVDYSKRALYNFDSLSVTEKIYQASPSTPHFSQDKIKEQKTQKMVADYKIEINHDQDAPLEDTSKYIEQYTEAIADYRAAPGFLNYVAKKYPNNAKAQRDAVLSLLFSFKPSPFEGKDLDNMNKVGSKKMNETRVLRNILANKQIQKILGCQFQEQPPLDCSDPNVLAGFRNSGTMNQASNSRTVSR